MTLTNKDAADLAFKRRVTPGAMFYFMISHRIMFEKQALFLPQIAWSAFHK
jgi:hypothetical protein